MSVVSCSSGHSTVARSFPMLGPWASPWFWLIFQPQPLVSCETSIEFQEILLKQLIEPKMFPVSATKNPDWYSHSSQCLLSGPKLYFLTKLKVCRALSRSGWSWHLSFLLFAFGISSSFYLECGLTLEVQLPFCNHEIITRKRPRYIQVSAQMSWASGPMPITGSSKFLTREGRKSLLDCFSDYY